MDKMGQEGKKTRRRKGKREDAVHIATIVVTVGCLAEKGVGARQMQVLE